MYTPHTHRRLPYIAGSGRQVRIDGVAREGMSSSSAKSETLGIKDPLRKYSLQTYILSTVSDFVSPPLLVAAEENFPFWDLGLLAACLATGLGERRIKFFIFIVTLSRRYCCRLIMDDLVFSNLLSTF